MCRHSPSPLPFASPLYPPDPFRHAFQRHRTSMCPNPIEPPLSRLHPYHSIMRFLLLRFLKFRGFLMIKRIINLFFLPLAPFSPFSNDFFLPIYLLIFNMLLLIGLGLLSWFYLTNFAKMADGPIHYKFTIIFPAIAIILTFLAYKAIKKDEKLVRSVDRIR